MRLIGINGFKTAGKDTAAGFIAEALRPQLVERVAFADKLKIAAAAAIGLRDEGATEQWMHDESMIYAMNQCKEDWHFEIWRTETNKDVDPSDPQFRTERSVSKKIHEFSGREYLQWFGTECGRQTFGDEFWVDLVLPRMDPCPNDTNGDGDCGKHYCPHCGVNASDYKLKEMYPGVDVLVVTDPRFPNEAKRIKDLGGEMWEITRPGLSGDGHASEIPLDESLIDYKITNDGSLDDLAEKVKGALYSRV